MQKVDVTVPRKKGPFYLRKLLISELETFIGETQSRTMAGQSLFLVTTTLVTTGNKPVFASADDAEQALGAVQILELGVKALKYNEIWRIANLNKEIDDALKN